MAPRLKTFNWHTQVESNGRPTRPMTHAEKVAAYRKLKNSFDAATQARIELALGLTKSPRKAA